MIHQMLGRKYPSSGQGSEDVEKSSLIDYYLDEWHAEKYPEWIENETAGEMKVISAYGLKDAPGGLSNKAWCDKKGIRLLYSIEAVVNDSDYLIVLSPIIQNIT